MHNVREGAVLIELELEDRSLVCSQTLTLLLQWRPLWASASVARRRPKRTPMDRRFLGTAVPPVSLIVGVAAAGHRAATVEWSRTAARPANIVSPGRIRKAGRLPWIVQPSRIVQPSKPCSSA